jgi:signal transduction histidine kinase
VQSLDVLATAPAPEQFIERMLRTIGRLLDGQWVALWLLDDAGDALTLRAAIDANAPASADQDHPFVKDPALWKHDGSLQELFFTGVPIACEEIASDSRLPEALRRYLVAQGSKKLLRLPTLVGGQVKGFITIRHADREPYRTSEIELAQALAHQAMLAIQIGKAATLEERNRMARDIHDTLAQGFTAVIIQLQGAEDARKRGLETAVEQHLQSAHELARSSLNEARRSVRALRPLALEEATFWEALKALIRKATAGTKLQTTFRLAGDPRHLAPDAQEHLLHIGQEALTNTLRHAQASWFETRLSFANGDARFELEDDGAGFGVEHQPQGYGLIGMRERAAKIGAHLDITSAGGRGTKIVVICPMNRRV